MVFLWAEKGLRLHLNLADRLGDGCWGGGAVLAHEHVLFKPKTVNFNLKERHRHIANVIKSI